MNALSTEVANLSFDVAEKAILGRRAWMNGA